MITDEICCFLENEGTLLEEQKTCRRKSKSNADQFYTDKMLLQEVKQRKKNLACGWIDYLKVYDMVHHIWVMESSNMMDIAKNEVKFRGKQ